MKRISLLIIVALQTLSVAWGGEVSLETVDSLLTAYGKTHAKGRVVALGQEIIDCCTADDPLFDAPCRLTTEMSRDSIDLFVWFSAERFYCSNSYYKESLGYINRALPLTQDSHPTPGMQTIRATMLCDKGYCLYKTSQNAEAAETELEAERYSKKYGQTLSLARAYNYLAIINLGLGYIDEAKHFVQKAIETDKKAGSPLNTHNYLGIACEIYCVAGEAEKAVEYGLQAVEAARAIGYDAGVVNHLSQLSYAYNRAGNLERALSMARQAVATVEQMPIVDRNLLAISLEYEAYHLLDMMRNAEAVPSLRRAIALQQEVGNMRSVCYDHKSLAEALEPDSPRAALQALRRYSAMMDSLHYDEMHQVLSQSNARLHNDELQDENAATRRLNRLIMLSAILVVLLLLTLVGALVYAMRQRHRAHRALQHLQATRETFFTSVTHEFRTPLTVILGIARRWKAVAGTTSPQSLTAPQGLAESMTMIERNGEQLLTLVNQLLDISKVQSTIGTADWQTGNIIPCVIMTIERFRPLAESRGITLVSHIAETEITMDFVPDYLQRVVANLLSNAIRHTPKGGSVALSATPLRSNLQLTVADTGEGIDPADLPHVFEPFYQGRRLGQGEGTGIGLALVRQIVEAVGGTIRVESEVGQGSKFFVEVPIRNTRGTASAIGRTLETAPAIGQTQEPALTEAICSSPFPRILIVEDNADVAAYIGSCLGERYELHYAKDGAEGLVRARDLVPDLILTDLMMPGTDGLELCRQLRADVVTDHIPVIVITARATEQDRIEGIRAGADAYLYKPFNADELLVRIEKLLAQRQSLQQKWKPDTSQPDAQTLNPDVCQTADSGTEWVEQASRDFLVRCDEAVRSRMAAGELDAELVAASLAMSLSQFSRKLRSVAGVTPAAYIMEVRMAEARRLLIQSPRYTISDVALRCGFADTSHFSHAFRRHMGITPSQYIKENS